MYYSFPSASEDLHTYLHFIEIFRKRNKKWSRRKAKRIKKYLKSNKKIVDFSMILLGKVTSLQPLQTNNLSFYMYLLMLHTHAFSRCFEPFTICIGVIYVVCMREHGNNSIKNQMQNKKKTWEDFSGWIFRKFFWFLYSYFAFCKYLIYFFKAVSLIENMYSMRRCCQRLFSWNSNSKLLWTKARNKCVNSQRFLINVIIVYVYSCAISMFTETNEQKNKQKREKNVFGNRYS